MAVCNAGIANYGGAAVIAPTITSEQQNVLRSHGNLQQISYNSKTIDTPYSSVSKSDVRVSNPGIQISSPVAYAAPAYHHQAYVAPAYKGKLLNSVERFINSSFFVIAQPVAYQAAYHAQPAYAPAAYHAQPAYQGKKTQQVN